MSGSVSDCVCSRLRFRLSNSFPRTYSTYIDDTESRLEASSSSIYVHTSAAAFPILLLLWHVALTRPVPRGSGFFQLRLPSSNGIMDDGQTCPHPLVAHGHPSTRYPWGAAGRPFGICRRMLLCLPVGNYSRSAVLYIVRISYISYIPAYPTAVHRGSPA